MISDISDFLDIDEWLRCDDHGRQNDRLAHEGMIAYWLACGLKLIGRSFGRKITLWI